MLRIEEELLEDTIETDYIIFSLTSTFIEEDIDSELLSQLDSEIYEEFLKSLHLNTNAHSLNKTIEELIVLAEAELSVIDKKIESKDFSEHGPENTIGSTPNAELVDGNKPNLNDNNTPADVDLTNLITVEDLFGEKIDAEEEKENIISLLAGPSDKKTPYQIERERKLFDSVFEATNSYSQAASALYKKKLKDEQMYFKDYYADDEYDDEFDDENDETPICENWNVIADRMMAKHLAQVEERKKFEKENPDLTPEQQKKQLKKQELIKKNKEYTDRLKLKELEQKKLRQEYMLQELRKLEEIKMDYLQNKTDDLIKLLINATTSFESKKKENMLKLAEGNKTPDNIKKFFRSSAHPKSKKIKNFFWKFYGERYSLKFPCRDFPKMGFITSLLFARSIRKWTKLIFYSKQKRFFFDKKFFNKWQIKNAVKNKIAEETGVAPEHPGLRMDKRLKKTLFKDFKSLLSLGKRSIKSIHKTLGRFLLNPNSLLLATDTSSEIPLTARNHLNKKILKRKTISFLYKKPKNWFLQIIAKNTYNKQLSGGVDNVIYDTLDSKLGEFRTTFINLYKKYSWKLRIARLVHWDTRVYGKLNERRYIKLLGYELMLFTRYKLSQLLTYVMVRTFCLAISWFALEYIRNYVMVVYNGIHVDYNPHVEKGDIVELPTGQIFLSTKKQLKKSFKKIISKVKRLSYRSYLINTKQIKKAKIYTKTPKIYKQLPIGLKKFGNILSCEVSAGLLSIVKRLPHVTHDLKNSINLTTVLALQIWRYRFD